ncbi:MAG TPA: metallopeptidase TldD-related protein [Deltaproteobacteria bacterium]|nr:metallopeptidase TldD-related protein [Deltaproteobacteria bacterium]
MGLGDKIAKAVNLLKARAIRDFEVYGSDVDTIRAESKACSPGFLNRSNESGISIRILDKGSLGFAYGPEASEELIDAAISSARYQFKDAYNHIPPYYENYTTMDLVDHAVADLRAEDCISQAISLERTARESDSRVKQVRKASFSRSIASSHIVNSNGTDISSKSTFVSSSIMVMVKDGEDTQSGYEFDLGHCMSDINIERTGTRAVRNATDMLFAKKIRTTRIPVVFDNSSTAQMLDFISDAFVGENIIKGKSYLRDKRGKTCFSSMITITDNPLDERSTSACPYDGEGCPSRKTVLVEKGNVCGFLYDSYWGMAADEPSTGNSVRGGYRSVPVVGIRHMCLEPGREDLTQIMRGLKQLLKITDIMGMHTANPITGEFSIGVNGLLLEENSVLHPVREAALAGNIYEMFSRVGAVGNDVREFGHILCPSLLIEEMDISSQ